MAITSIPPGIEPTKPEEEKDLDNSGAAAETGVPLRAVHAAPSPAEHIAHGGGGPGRASQRPKTGWALEPGASKRRARAEHQPVGTTAAIVASTAVVLGGLGAWAGFSSFSNQSGSWETGMVPKGPQAYYVPHIENVVVPPAIAKTAKAAAQAKLAAKENPMVVTTPTTHVVLKVNPPPLHGRYAPNGQVYATWSPTYFTVPAGKTIHVTVLNYDTGFHTFTSTTLHVNVMAHPSANGTTPWKTTFTFKAPSTGYFSWFCNVPCTPFSMSRGGLMKGEVHAVKS